MHRGKPCLPLLCPVEGLLDPPAYQSDSVTFLALYCNMCSFLTNLLRKRLHTKAPVSEKHSSEEYLLLTLLLYTVALITATIPLPLFPRVTTFEWPISDSLLSRCTSCEARNTSRKQIYRPRIQQRACLRETAHGKAFLC